MDAKRIISDETYSSFGQQLAPSRPAISPATISSNGIRHTHHSPIRSVSPRRSKVLDKSALKSLYHKGLSPHKHTHTPHTAGVGSGGGKMRPDTICCSLKTIEFYRHRCGGCHGCRKSFSCSICTQAFILTFTSPPAPGKPMVAGRDLGDGRVRLR